MREEHILRARHYDKAFHGLLCLVLKTMLIVGPISSPSLQEGKLRHRTAK